MPHSKGTGKTHLPVSLCQAGEFTLSRFSEARGEGQAVLDGEGTPLATHGTGALDLGRQRTSGMESL